MRRSVSARNNNAGGLDKKSTTATVKLSKLRSSNRISELHHKNNMPVYNIIARRHKVFPPFSPYLPIFRWTQFTLNENNKYIIETVQNNQYNSNVFLRRTSIINNTSSSWHYSRDHEMPFVCLFDCALAVFVRSVKIWSRMSNWDHHHHSSFIWRDERTTTKWR